MQVRDSQSSEVPTLPLANLLQHVNPEGLTPEERDFLERSIEGGAEAFFFGQVLNKQMRKLDKCVEFMGANRDLVERCKDHITEAL